MKKMIYISFVLLFLLPIAYSELYFEDPIEITGSPSGDYNHDRISGFYDNGYFYIGYSKGNIGNGEMLISKYKDDNFVIKADGWDDISSGLCYYGSCSINYYNSTHGSSFIDSGQSNRYLKVFSLNNLVAGTLWTSSVSHLNNCSKSQLATSYLTKGSNPVITSRAIDCTNNYYFNANSSEYATYFPSSYTDVKKIFTIERNNNYLLFFNYKVTGTTTDMAMVNIFSNRILSVDNYINTQTVTDPADILTFNVSQVSATNKGEAVYVSYLTNSSSLTSDTDTGGSPYDKNIRIQSFLVNSDQGLLFTIFSQLYKPTNVGNATQNYTGTPYLYYSDQTEKFYLFYTVWNYTNDANLGLFVAKQDVTCNCENWVNTSTCIDSYRVRQRVCNPSGCNNENDTVWDSVCNETGGAMPQRTEIYRNSTACGISGVQVGEIAECVLEPLKIPDNCINVNTTVLAIPSFYIDNSDCSYGNLRLEACNPTYDCNTTWYPCNQYNNTARKDKNDYMAGDTVIGKVSLYAESSCLCYSTLPLIDLRLKILGGYGIKEYSVVGTLYIECEIPCKEEWLCRDDFNSALRNIDCSVSNYTSCEFGCNQNSGRCYPSADKSDNTVVSPLYWWNFIFNPATTSQKFMMSMVGCFLLSSFILSTLGSITSGESFKYFIVSFASGWVFFTIIGWIPSIMIIIMVFFIGGYFLLDRLRGS